MDVWDGVGASTIDRQHISDASAISLMILLIVLYISSFSFSCSETTQAPCKSPSLGARLLHTQIYACCVSVCVCVRARDGGGGGGDGYTCFGPKKGGKGGDTIHTNAYGNKNLAKLFEP